MAKKNHGKEFENQWKDSCPEDVYFMRIKDNANWGGEAKFVIASKNPCDYIMYSYPNLFLLELKSTKGTSFSFDERIIKAHQISSLYEANKIKGIIAGFVFNFRERETQNTSRENITYFITIDEFVKFKQGTDKKSINEEDCSRIGMIIGQRKKIIKYEYDVRGFVDYYNQRTLNENK